MNIPDGAEYYIKTGSSCKFYQEGVAFNLQLLWYWNEYDQTWKVCGYHPWDELQPISDLKESQ